MASFVPHTSYTAKGYQLLASGQDAAAASSAGAAMLATESAFAQYQQVTAVQGERGDGGTGVRVPAGQVQRLGAGDARLDLAVDRDHAMRFLQQVAVVLVRAPTGERQHRVAHPIRRSHQNRVVRH